MPDGHELPGSLPAHAHLADVHPVGSGARGPRAARAADRASASAQYREGLRRVLPRVRRHRLAGAARRNPSVVVIPGLGLFGFGKDKREARITTEFFVNAIHVMAGANALEDDGGAGRHAAAGPAAGAGAGLQELPQLRRAAAARGVPDRVLGARGSQAPADAAGEGVQPQGGRGRRRRQRHRPRGRAADRDARRTRGGRRPERGGRRGDEGRRGEAVVAGDGAGGADGSHGARHHRGGAARVACCSSAASTRSINTAAHLPDAGSVDAGRRRVGAGRCRSTSRPTSCWRRKRRRSSRRRTCRRRSC